MKISCNAMHPEYAKPCTLIPHAEGPHQAYVGGVGLVTWGDVPKARNLLLNTREGGAA